MMQKNSIKMTLLFKSKEYTRTIELMNVLSKDVSIYDNIWFEPTKSNI